MIYFFENQSSIFYAVDSTSSLTNEDISKLNWLFGNAKHLNVSSLQEAFIGPRATMITPWSTNAVEITQNMGVEGILRIEEFIRLKEDSDFDPMLSQKFTALDQSI